MKKLSLIESFKDAKISTRQMNQIYGGTSCCDESATENGECGDTTSTWYNEDGSFCCSETTNHCCPVT